MQNKRIQFAQRVNFQTTGKNTHKLLLLKRCLPIPKFCWVYCIRGPSKQIKKQKYRKINKSSKKQKTVE